MTQSSIDGFSTASQMLQALRQRQLSAVELLDATPAPYRAVQPAAQRHHHGVL